VRILAIESSCDDTSVALVERLENGRIVVIEQKTASQIDVHKKYGGVIPEIAGRKHAENILPVLEDVMTGQKKPDAIAVTAGPGLMTGLLVGTEVAKTLSYLWEVPLIPVNHIEGHVYSGLIDQDEEIQLPAVSLITSGGHTELTLMKDHGDFELIGKTRDDAAGEAFDKVAKLLGMEYPGGPKISALALEGNPEAIKFPRPMMAKDNYDFSFAGLKTAVLYYLRDNPEEKKEDVAASFEQASIDVLVEKTRRAIIKHNPKSLILGGGVSNNEKLRVGLQEICTEKNINFIIPQRKYTMDNAAMIGAAAFFNKEQNWKELLANPNWKVYI
jgi:N6-L-threonylcarbamoyladenine synthase